MTRHKSQWLKGKMRPGSVSRRVCGFAFADRERRRQCSRQLSSTGHPVLLKHLLCAFLLLALASSVSADTINLYPRGTMNLIPQPTHFEWGKSPETPFLVTDQTRLFLPPLERPEWLAVEGLLADMQTKWGRRPVLDRRGALTTETAAPAIDFQVKDPAGDGEGYTLDITGNSITLVADSPVGLLQGIRTLRQAVLHSPRMGGIGPLHIKDAPAFKYRGFYLDVSRGKVPTLATLKHVVDIVASYKVNQLQLYIEHPFAFRFNPAISHGDAITPDEILALQEYCRDRRIDLVPSLQSFGHMAGVLSLPEYRELADVEPTKSFEEMTWQERMSGTTINCRDPKALALLEQMHDAYVSLHDSPYLNVCADETYDLGKGKTASVAEEIGKGRLYLSHINWLNDLSKKQGKRMMFWGDIVKEHEELIPEIPRDTILLNWGYFAGTDYESCKLFADAGLDFYVCPGTSGWVRFLNDVNNADLNIRRYAAAGKKYGAIGLLNTDWGDRGHINPLAGSLHGIALGAAMAWNPDAPDADEFDMRWNDMVFGDSNGGAIKALRAQSTGMLSWIAFQTDFEDYAALKKWRVTEEQAVKLAEAAPLGIKTFTHYQKVHMGNELDVAELLQGSRMNALAAEKVLLMFELQRAEGKPDAKLRARFKKLAKGLSDTAPAYRELWLARNKPSDMERAINAIAAVERQALRYSRMK
ncbi:family 20 glycosylhydrolase [bacterium]|nr:family 20 glycosylhydrolase [bacterium]